MGILFKGLSLQKDCHYLLYPSVGMLPDASCELHSNDAKGQANSLSIDLPRDIEFYIEMAMEFLNAVHVRPWFF